MTAQANRRVVSLAAIVFALLLVVALIAAFWPRGEKMRVAADFPSTVALFKKSEVKILGITIGQVTDIEPRGKLVHVEMEYDSDYKLPADVKAVIVSPNVVADRFVQFTPAYRGGPTLPNGALIPADRTAVPLELDRVFGSLNDLTEALGPEGANQDGSLARLLKVGRNNLEDEGENLNATITGLSKMVGTLSDGREDLFGTVRDLQKFSSALAANDSQVREFNTDLASVADQLSGEREELSAALKNLSVALGEVNTFVRDNKAVIATSVDHLAEVTSVLAKQKRSLEEILDTAPVALTNLGRAHNPGSGTLDTRNNFSAIANDPATFLCTVYKQFEPADAASVCKGPIADLLKQIPLGDLLSGSPSAQRAVLMSGSSSRDLTLGGIVEANR